MSGDFSTNGPREPAPEPSPEGEGGRRLPPPAFPPGSRRASTPRRAVEADNDAGDMAGAFISPDEPLPERSSLMADAAFISPDEPIPHRPPRSAPVAVDDEEGDDDFGEGVVTGIGDDAHLDPEELALGFDPYVLEVVGKVNKLAEALKHRGEAGLRATPDMTRFEATLRSYCVGYLSGRRAEDEEG